MQVFRDKEGRRVSKEEYLEQQAAAKKKAQVGGARWPGRLAGVEAHAAMQVLMSLSSQRVYF